MLEVGSGDAHTDQCCATDVDVTDYELAVAVRSGDFSAFGTLYLRHVRAALHFALQFHVDQVVAEDVVAESFTGVFAALRAGGGSAKQFKSYLFATVQANLYGALRHERRDELTDDPVQGRWDDTTDDMLDSMLESVFLSRALMQLPARWQAVLWSVEVEGRSVSEVATRLNVSSRAVIAIACHARERLRNAYLRVRLGEGIPDECQRFVSTALGLYAVLP